MDTLYSVFKQLVQHPYTSIAVTVPCVYLSDLAALALTGHHVDLSTPLVENMATGGALIGCIRYLPYMQKYLDAFGLYVSSKLLH